MNLIMLPPFPYINIYKYLALFSYPYRQFFAVARTQVERKISCICGNRFGIGDLYRHLRDIAPTRYRLSQSDLKGSHNKVI